MADTCFRCCEGGTADPDAIQMPASALCPPSRRARPPALRSGARARPSGIGSSRRSSAAGKQQCYMRSFSRVRPLHDPSPRLAVPAAPPARRRLAGLRRQHLRPPRRRPPVLRPRGRDRERDVHDRFRDLRGWRRRDLQDVPRQGVRSQGVRARAAPPTRACAAGPARPGPYARTRAPKPVCAGTLPQQAIAYNALPALPIPPQVDLPRISAREDPHLYLTSSAGAFGAVQGDKVEACSDGGTKRVTTFAAPSYTTTLALKCERDERARPDGHSWRRCKRCAVSACPAHGILWVATGKTHQTLCKAFTCSPIPVAQALTGPASGCLRRSPSAAASSTRRPSQCPSTAPAPPHHVRWGAAVVWGRLIWTDTCSKAALACPPTSGAKGCFLFTTICAPSQLSQAPAVPAPTRPLRRGGPPRRPPRRRRHRPPRRRPALAPRAAASCPAPVRLAWSLARACVATPTPLLTSRPSR